MKAIICAATVLSNMSGASAMNMTGYASMPNSASMPYQNPSMTGYASMPNQASMPHHNYRMTRYASMPDYASMPTYTSMPNSASMPYQNPSMTGYASMPEMVSEPMPNVNIDFNWNSKLIEAVFEANDLSQVKYLFENQSWWTNYENLEQVSYILEKRSESTQIDPAIFDLLNRKLLEGAKLYKNSKK